MSLRAISLSLFLALAVASGLSVPARAQTTISNTASLSFTQNGVDQTLQSNTVTLAAKNASTPVITFMRLAGGSPGQSMDSSGSQCQLPSGAWTPVVQNSVQSFDPSTASLADASAYEPGDPVFVQVVAPDSNLDPNVRDTITITLSTAAGDSEALVVRETGPNTGIFMGFINSDDALNSTPNNCSLTLFRGGTLSARFADAVNSPVSDTALVDPFGFVFSTATSLPVSGVKITLIDDSTGKPATVLGVDGVSAYPSTVISGQNAMDASGKIYTNVDGEYRFPQVAPGRYHLLIVPPDGYSAPSTVPMSKLATLTTPVNTPFALGPGSTGGSFEVVQGVDIQIDVPVDPHQGGLVVSKTASATDASLGDLVQYRIKVQNPDATVSDAGVSINDVLPVGFRYVAGSARRDGLKIADPAVGTNGRALTFPLGTLAAGANTEVYYVTRLGADAHAGPATNRATAVDSTGAVSNLAEAMVRVSAPFYTDAAALIGRVIEGGCRRGDKDRVGVAGVRIVLEDGTFTVTDKDGRYHFEAVRTGLHVVQMDVDSLPATLEPQACGRDTRTGGRAFSQFVDLQGGALWRSDFHLRRVAKAKTTTAAAAPAQVEDTVAAGEGRDWLAGEVPGPAAFLFPTVDHNPRAPAVRVAVKHAPSEVVNLTVNGAPVEPLTLDSDTKSADGRMAVILWRGVPLREGDNTLVAIVSDLNHHEIARLTRVVHYANTPAHAEVVAERSHLLADGLTRPVVAVRITDSAGKPVRAGVMGSFSIAAPYTSAAALDAMQKHQLSGQDGGATTWRITGDDGVALIELGPTSQAGAVLIDMPMPGDVAGHSTQARAWLSADREKWMVVGFGAGTLGYETLSRRALPLQSEGDHPAFTDGQLAFYAKGRIKGSWLLTMAYDSNRNSDPQRGLLGAIDPDRYYSVYGDGSAQGQDAPSQGKLYIRLERKAFYALFGDFQTGFDATELGRYSRTLNGLKFERQGKVFNVSGFAAQTEQVAIRDEIQGLGLSGPYQLSRHDIAPNSDKLTLETRARGQTDKVISSLSLTAGIDYDIDYTNGVVNFHQPVLSVDADLNPNIIVAEYEVQSGGVKATQAGLRAAATLAGGKVKAGVTLLHDGQKLQTASGNVVAADLVITARRDTQIKLEAAVSDPNAAGLRTQHAYLAEVEHHSSRDEVLAYFRQEDAAYGLNQQSGAELGVRKAGVDGKLHLGSGLSVSASGYHETYLTSGDTRNVVDGRVDYTFHDWRLSAELKFVHDQTSTDGSANSDLLTLGAARDLLNHKLQLTAATDFALGGQAESVDFPARHRLGLSYAVNDNVHLNLSHEIVDGATYTAQTTRFGAEVQPWKGARLTAGADEQAITENGARTFAQFGLTQTIAISKRWTVDAAVDSSSALNGHAPANLAANSNQVLGTSGTTYANNLSQTGAAPGVVVESFHSASLGAAYRADTWSWNIRAEARLGSTADTWSVRSAWLRQLAGGVVAAADVSANETRTTNGALSSTAQVNGSLAWRPLDSHWSALDKLTLRNDDARNTAQGQALAGFGALAVNDGSSKRIVNNLAVNYDSGAEGEHGHGQWQVSAYYGAKYVQGRFDSDTFTGLVDVTGLEGRYDLSSRIDVGFSASVQHAWSDHNVAFAFGPSVGLSPAANTWVSVGWNVTGFRDRDFEEARYTRQGPYVTFRVKFDQMSLAPMLRHIQGGRS